MRLDAISAAGPLAVSAIARLSRSKRQAGGVTIPAVLRRASHREASCLEVNADKRTA